MEEEMEVLVLVEEMEIEEVVQEDLVLVVEDQAQVVEEIQGLIEEIDLEEIVEDDIYIKWQKP